MTQLISPHLSLAREYWASLLSPTDWVIDATVGNGHDTLFLSQLACGVVGLDIQPQAIANTAARTDGKNVRLYLKSHAEIASVPLPCPPKLIVYNLGYLPGGDKAVTTICDSTLQSVRASLALLAPGGALSITCYPRHAEGRREEEALLAWSEQLSREQWSVCHHRWKPLCPTLLWICAHRS